MTTSHTVKFLSPEEIVSRSATEVPFLRLAPADVFALRGVRLRELAADHPMGDYLRFAAQIAEAQHAALGNLPFLALPAESALAEARERGMPPLHVTHMRRHPEWCEILRRILRVMVDRAQGLPAPVISTLTALERASDELYEAQLSKLLNGITVGLDIATAPLIGAAAQVYWKHLAASHGADAFPRIEAETVCPVCGSRPTASVLRIGGDEGGHRYLHCSVCESEWHMVRIKCSNCESTAKVHYHQVDDTDGVAGGRHFKAVRAETCDDCGTYLKVFHQDRDPHVDPVADDIASVALDLLVAEAGFLRSGQNLLLIHGETE